MSAYRVTGALVSVISISGQFGRQPLTISKPRSSTCILPVALLFGLCSSFFCRKYGFLNYLVRFSWSWESNRSSQPQLTNPLPSSTVGAFWSLTLKSPSGSRPLRSSNDVLISNNRALHFVYLFYGLCSLFWEIACFEVRIGASYNGDLLTSVKTYSYCEAAQVNMGSNSQGGAGYGPGSHWWKDIQISNEVW